MAQALAIDLDGTLLVGEEIPAENVRAVRAARDAGLKIVIATARWHHMALRVERLLGIEGGLVIACSGAQAYVPAERRDLFDHRLPAEFASELYALCDAERCVATVPLTDRVLLKMDGRPDPALLAPELQWVRKLTGADADPPRVGLIQGGAVNARIRAELEPRWKDRVHFFDSVGPSGKVVLTMTSAEANKGAALLAACTYLGVEADQVVAFGDAENDIAMFKVAGASVAMGQASDQVKQAATIVTGTNVEAGVAQVIDRLLATGGVSP